MSILIKNITVVSEEQVLPNQDILIEGKHIMELGESVSGNAQETIDGTGLYAFPGFVDMHSHLRDPGFTYKEDIASGTQSAAAGGFTSVCCMPNTKPVIDHADVVRYILEEAKKTGAAKVLPVACITKGMKGNVLTNFTELKKAGAIAFSDDGLPVVQNSMIEQAMLAAKEANALLMLHEEDLSLRGDGVANEGENARKAGLLGISNEVEDGPTRRDILLAEKTGARVHFCHVSTKGSVQLIREGKKRGAPITCETGPHYFSLEDSVLLGRSANTKVNPPIRSKGDVNAIIEGIIDGTIDAIATDHAPHSEQEKLQTFEAAPFGLIGFETAFALVVTNLLEKNRISICDIVKLMSTAPRRILGIGGGCIQKGGVADIAICDINQKRTVQKEEIVSKAKNSPYIGMELTGQVLCTFVDGRIRYDNRQAYR